MKKEKDNDELRMEYDISKLKNRTVGKYAERCAEGTNIVLLEPDVAQAFPNSVEVNKALRKLLADKGLHR